MGEACGEWINPKTGEGGSRHMMNMYYEERMSRCPTWNERSNDWLRPRQGNTPWYRNYSTKNDPFSPGLADGN
jgi:hypothetical protein